jgi:hypothetical protein
MARPNHLFYTFDLRNGLESSSQKLAAEIAAVPSNKLLNLTPDDLADQFFERFHIEVPVIRDADIQVSQNEVQVDVSHDPMRAVFDRSRPFYVAGTSVTFHVPFDGEAKMFGAKPSTFSMRLPVAEVRGQELVFTFERLDHDAEAVKRDFERELGEVKEWIEWVRNDVKQFNDSLRIKAKQIIERRREKVLKDQGLASQLGFPLRRREDAPKTFAIPTARRQRPSVAHPKADKPFVPEPALDAAEYDHIISVIDNMVKVMERSPAAFAAMKEEDLRQHFLVQLNGQYEGQATGETFNYSGKTDILIRADGKNVFVGECKFWDGPKVFGEALNQLLGYATWRDAKLALIIFNRTKNLSAVLEKIPGLVRSNPHFRRDVPFDHGGTGWRFIVHHPDDPDRELTLTVVVYEIPA